MDDNIDYSSLILISESDQKAKAPEAPLRRSTPSSAPIEWLPEAPPPAPPPPEMTETVLPSPVQNLSSSQQLAAYLPGFVTLTQRIIHEISMNPRNLLALNRSRREALLEYLMKLAGMPPMTGSKQPHDPDLILRRWVEGPRTFEQEKAYRTYLEELALIYIGKVILAVSWSERGLATINRKTSDLNHALSQSVKPYLPLGRESWMLLRQNLYSWFKPSPVLHHEIWDTMERLPLPLEDPTFVFNLLKQCRQTQPDLPEHRGYDSRFFETLWKTIASFGINPFTEPSGPFKRKRVAFSPTLRDGDLVLSAPKSLEWTGIEENSFRLMLLELSFLWPAPAAPAVWDCGTGLEVHSKEQLHLTWNSPKPTLTDLISEQEACDFSFVLEERIRRPQGRAAEALWLKNDIEKYPYFKKLRGQATSLGTLQACIAINKLRPDGLFFWARESPLTPEEGTDALRFLWDRGMLLCEWDFSQIIHMLPSTVPLFPKYLYLFKREPSYDLRNQNRPTQVHVRGEIRSHIEVPIILNEILNAYQQPPHPRGNWQFHIQQSPVSQGEWLEHWPNSNTEESLRRIDVLKKHAVHLGQIAVIRAVNDLDAENLAAVWRSRFRGPTLLIYPTANADGSETSRRLTAIRILPDAPPPPVEKISSGFIFSVSDSSWIGPLRSYLESEAVAEWLDCHTERKNQKWVLKDQTIKFLPIPEYLVKILQNSLKEEVTFIHKEAVFNVSKEPEKTMRLLGTYQKDKILHSLVFIEATQKLEERQSYPRPIETLIGENQQVIWSEILQILPKKEITQFSIHPEIRLEGQLPTHVPISKIQLLKTQLPSIFMCTETGLSVRIISENSLMIDILWDQVKNLSHPTWGELTQFACLPRQSEIAELTAAEVLKMYQNDLKKRSELHSIINACQIV